MSYPVNFSQISIVLSRQCNQLRVYDKVTNSFFDFGLHELYVNNGGAATPQYYRLSVSNNQLTITQVNPPDATWTEKLYVTKITVDEKLLHALWTDDNGTPYIVIGIGDTRDLVTSLDKFSLEEKLVLSSDGPDRLKVFFK